jgi:uncharacterized protein
MPIARELATINPNADTEPFWEACRRRELRLQQCGSCRRFRHPPIPGCPHCGSTEIEWTRVAGRGRVFSYTTVHHAALPALADRVPYVVAVVELEDAPGARLVGNLVGTGDGLAIGMPVEVEWDEVEPDVVLPQFRRA